jgi:NAD dependent epimerase/dehydratase
MPRFDRILVTGAGGFIGSHLVELLLREGEQVRAFVRYTAEGGAGNLRFLPRELAGGLEVLRGDLCDADAVRGAVRGTDAVLHLGAAVAIPYSYQHPRETAAVNVGGTLNVLAACRDLGVSRLVVTSTSEVYGTARTVPIDEAHPLQAQSPYSATKIAADALATSFHCSFALPVVILRPFNTYGPRQSARAVIPAIIVQALAGPVVRLGALHPRRDLTFVTDTAGGFLAALTVPDAVGKTVHLGVGQSISIGELALRIAGLLGREIEIQCDTSRLRPAASEVRELLSDNRYAAQLLGWSPRVSLDAGLRATIEWIAAHGELYRSDAYAV